MQWRFAQILSIKIVIRSKLEVKIESLPDAVVPRGLKSREWIPSKPSRLQHRPPATANSRPDAGCLGCFLWATGLLVDSCVFNPIKQ